MATRTAQAVTVAGVTPTYHAATATTGDKVLADSRTWIHVKNGSGGAITVTVSGAGQTSYGVALPDKVYNVTTGAEMWIPMLPDFGDPDDGRLVTFVCSSATSVTFAVGRI
ncbi:hypothetical protein [Nonomuraea pusilla]|uniref:Uncharacterized protein n=1 Tax=Nonomuraea pusilla TaxID=46177 RepID=A0A1H8K1M8_9ACTN|nr:hypothetical protein [Nonomuraea pusilla]SEN86681.1 hypothetical protein SAMN05660976_08495 [Nonomuraea pusilla]